jgi:hypothetical protein
VEYRVKKSRIRLLAALGASLLLTAIADAEHPVAEAQHHQRVANQAYQTGDYVAFTRSMERAHELNPASFATKYNLACGYARTGRAEDALKLLQELTSAQVDFGMASDPDLESLRELPRFRELVETLSTSITPISNSEPFLTIEQLGIAAEGIAFDSKTGRLFLGSMRSGDVYVIDADKQFSKFASLADSGVYSAIGLTVDHGRNVLWVVATAFFMAEGFDADDPGAAGIFGFDLDTAKLQHKYLVDESVSGFNDVVVAPNGDVYVSGDALHVLAADSEELRPLPASPEPFASNGITIDSAGKTLFVSSYPVGIAVVDIVTGELRYLDSPADRPLYGIDGLYWHNGELIGIQNGIQPWRLLRMQLNDDVTAVSSVHIIEFANRALTATTGAIDGEQIHYVGQGPAPQNAPSQFPPALAPYLGKTVIMTAPLD